MVKLFETEVKLFGTVVKLFEMVVKLFETVVKLFQLSLYPLLKINTVCASLKCFISHILQILNNNY